MMLLLAILSLFLFSVKSEIQQQPANSIVIYFTCWYNTYEEGVRYRNAVLGYNSTFNTTVNITQPPSFNELDIDGTIIANPITNFLPGIHQAALNVPRGNAIEWQINSTNPAAFSFVDVVLSDLDNSTMCWNLFSRSCSIVNTSEAAIPHFCEDGNFCNNREFC